MHLSAMSHEGVRGQLAEAYPNLSSTMPARPRLRMHASVCIGEEIPNPTLAQRRFTAQQAGRWQMVKIYCCLRPAVYMLFGFLQA